MKVALLLHIYQPPVQEESLLRQIAFECYLPLIKLFKNRKNHKLTLNIPLSLLELMDKYGYKDWISDIKTMYGSDRIELTGSAAYHPLLTKLPQILVEQEIALNEYGLGYYFGSQKGFEGEPSIMIKNIQGFFPPELAVNADLANILSDYNYNWFLAEETALPGDIERGQCVYGFEGMAIKMVCRDRNVSNLLSFKRDTSIDDVISYLVSGEKEGRPVVIALDGEFFGHHYRDGIYLLETILDKLEKMGVYLDTVSNVIDDYDPVNINGVVESSWGASDVEFAAGDLYPFWVNNENLLQKKLWDFQNKLVGEYKISKLAMEADECCTAPIWKNLDSINDPITKEMVRKYMLLHKFLNSDKFWWVSKKDILGKHLFHPGLVKSALSLVSDLSKDSSEIEDIEKLLS